MISTEYRDMYMTPHWCYKALELYINWQSITRSVFEPCSGDGRIAKWIISHNKVCIVRDPIHDEGYDFMNLETYEYIKYQFIISNPPYSQAQDIVEHSLNIADTCCWLLRLGFLASQKRKELFIKHPLDALYVLSKRPSFDGKGTDNSEYAWFIWDKLGIFNKHGIVHL